MKILHFSSAKTWRGGEQQIAYLQAALQQKGITQCFFCPIDSALANFCQQEQIPLLTYRKRFSTNPLVAFQLKKICQYHKIDLVHLHDAHSHTFGFMSALFGNKVPFVLSRRVDFPVQKNWLSYKKYNHSAIKKILSVSKYVQTILSPAIIDKTKLQVVYSGVDLHRFSFKHQSILRTDFPIPTTTKIIANVAAIAPHKDYFTFVDTAEILLKKNKAIKFLIIGADGGERTLIEDYIAKKKLVDDIILTGFRNDIPKILPEIDVFLFTSKEEGLGTSLIDALVCQVPVVATAAGGIPEIIKNGQNGFLAAIQDAKELAHQVEKILSDSELKEKLIREGIKTATQFSNKVMAEKTLEVYKKILSAT